jgi:Leucine-rich repeat (LRR) protein
VIVQLSASGIKDSGAFSFFIFQIHAKYLSYVNLEDNLITSLADNTLSQASALAELRIGSNPFTELPIGFVEGLGNLYHIDISKGSIRVSLDYRAL